MKPICLGIPPRCSRNRGMRFKMAREEKFMITANCSANISLGSFLFMVSTKGNRTDSTVQAVNRRKILTEGV